MILIHNFDTTAIENVTELVMEYNVDEIMMIESTISVGYTKSFREKIGSKILSSVMNS